MIERCVGLCCAVFSPCSCRGGAAFGGAGTGGDTGHGSSPAREPRSCAPGPAPRRSLPSLAGGPGLSPAPPKNPGAETSPLISQPPARQADTLGTGDKTNTHTLSSSVPRCFADPAVGLGCFPWVNPGSLGMQRSPGRGRQCHCFSHTLSATLRIHSASSPALF